MKKLMRGLASLTLIIAGLSAAGVTQAAADVSISVNLGPPVIMVDEPAEMVFVPDMGVYYVPDSQWDIFFFRGLWWSHRGNYWYRSHSYRGGWEFARSTEVPGAVYRVPRDYRSRFSGQRHIRYQDWKERPGQPAHQRSEIGRNVAGGQGRGAYARPAPSARQGAVIGSNVAGGQRRAVHARPAPSVRTEKDKGERDDHAGGSDKGRDK